MISLRLCTRHYHKCKYQDGNSTEIEFNNIYYFAKPEHLFVVSWTAMINASQLCPENVCFSITLCASLEVYELYGLRENQSTSFVKRSQCQRRMFLIERTWRMIVQWTGTMLSKLATFHHLHWVVCRYLILKIKDLTFSWRCSSKQQLFSIPSVIFKLHWKMCDTMNQIVETLFFHTLTKRTPWNWHRVYSGTIHIYRSPRLISCTSCGGCTVDMSAELTGKSLVSVHVLFNSL